MDELATPTGACQISACQPYRLIFRHLQLCQSVGFSVRVYISITLGVPFSWMISGVFLGGVCLAKDDDE